MFLQCVHAPDVSLPARVVCEARTDLARLSMHLGPNGGARRVAVLQLVPDGPAVPAYLEFVAQLTDKQRVGVAKWDQFTLFLVRGRVSPLFSPSFPHTVYARSAPFLWCRLAVAPCVMPRRDHSSCATSNSHLAISSVV
jgi:hypothetical protein